MLFDGAKSTKGQWSLVYWVASPKGAKEKRQIGQATTFLPTEGWPDKDGVD